MSRLQGSNTNEARNILSKYYLETIQLALTKVRHSRKSKRSVPYWEIRAFTHHNNN